MTLKGAIRMLISCAIIWMIMSFVLPMFGFPHSRMLPAPIAYNSSAKNKTTGYVTSRKKVPSSNIFHSVDSDYLVYFQFRAKSVPGLGNVPPKEPTTVIHGRVNATEEYYGQVVKGQAVPVKYDATDPGLCGIDMPGAGRSGIGDGFIFNLWMVNLIIVLALGYMLAPWLERIFLRESY